MKSLVVLVLLLICAAPAAAEDYLPLETGNFWSYVTQNGDHEMRVVAGQVPILQGTPYAIEYLISPNDQGLVNYWSLGPDGDVLLWGFFRDGWGYVYQPPVVLVDAPLVVGKNWSTTLDVISLPDTTYITTAEFQYVAAEAQDVTVPAGTFSSFGIDSPDPDTKSLLDGRYTLWGTKVNDKANAELTWYSLGVGIVQEKFSDLLMLETYTDQPVATEVTTWGGVKALYRGND
jgi:hypothetical protein